ncbi:MAG: lipopolysaccharide heptosyltransferase II [Planctomycetes bacterium]|nr:lipopolysaccharide heptosyltransferase II [Planctomycetota bacterium]
MNIAVVCPNWIGDAVMATPTLEALKQLLPESKLTLIVRPYVAPVFDPAPYANKLLLWDGPGGKTLLQAAAELRKDSCELGLLMTNSFRSALLLRLGRVRQRVGYARDGRSLLLTNRLKAQKERGYYVPVPMLQYYFELIRPLGARNMSIAMKLYTRPADEQAADAVYNSLGLDPERTLILAPGAAFGLAKCWPPDRFGLIARRALDELGARTLVLCAPSERDTAARVRDASDSAAQLPPDPLPKLPTVKALVRRARAMVTNDSGLRHFAAAYDIPVVSIFGPTHINWTETWFHKEAKLQAPVPCGPCQKKRCPEGHLQCMINVTPEMVFEALSRLTREFPYREPDPDTIIRS